MKLLSCARCGSKELTEDGGYVTCAYCRSRFAPQADDRVKPATVLGVHSDIEALMKKCRDDPANRRRYANLILDLDPTNREALKYL